MNIRHVFKIYIFILVCLLVLSQLAFAGSIKQRMKQRLPVIAKLKTKGIIGEDNQGYLGFVTSVRKHEDVIKAENRDRKTIYTYFAKQQKTTIDVVQKVQAQRKAEKANPGEFYQTPDGKWVKK